MHTKAIISHKERTRKAPAMQKLRKVPEQSRQKSAFTTKFICMVLKDSGVITDELVAEIRKRDPKQRQLLQRQYGKHSVTQITPVDVISSMRLKLSSDAKKFLTEELIMKTLAAYWKLPFLQIDMSKLQPAEIFSKLPEPFVRKHLIVPVLLSKTMLIVATINPMDVEALDAVTQTTNLKVRPVISSKSDVLRAIERCYAEKRLEETSKKNRNDFRSFIRAATKDLPEPSSSKEEPILRPGDTGQYEEKHIVNAVNSLLHYAFYQNASDIHIEPKREYSAIRLRIDGLVHEFDRIPQEVHNNFVVRIKALAGMHIAEKRKPLDGSFRVNFHQKNIEFRISTMPVAFGEKIMIRVLDPTMFLQNIDDLGFSQEELAKYRSMISYNNGMLLVTGPTGSGKTTTLYSTLNSLAEKPINITTIEDPVELVHEAFNQIVVQPNIGLNFSMALRHIVRQASDVIMVGEIRDQETAESAFKAAISGHFVMSTLHTNDAPSAVVRLADMGVQPSLIESALIGVVSQQLVRKVCDMCGEPYSPSQQEMDVLQLSEDDLRGLPIRKGFGCQACRGTGYLGRTAIFEIMPITDGIKLLVHDNMAAHLIKRAAEREGMHTLQDSAMAKFKAGLTTSEEVLRIIGGIDLETMGE